MGILYNKWSSVVNLLWSETNDKFENWKEVLESYNSISTEFDYFGNAKIRKKILVNPDGEELHMLTGLNDVKYDLQCVNMSTMTFQVHRKTQDGVRIFYDDIQTKKRIIVDKIGEFVITSVETSGDGIDEVKSVTCKSLEYEMTRKTMTILDGTYKFYDPISPSETILGEVMAYLPGWKLGEIDSKLWETYRTFDLVTSNVYSFIVNDISKAYQCVFEFDTLQKIINVNSSQNAVNKTSIIMSYNNVVKKLNITENEDEFVTRLSIFGGGELSIRDVNPLGTPDLYNFNYYVADDQWMNAELKDAIVKWQLKFDNNQIIYATKLSELKDFNSTLLELNVQLSELNNRKKELELRQSLMIEGGQTNVPEYVRLLEDIKAKENEIKAKENEIKVKTVDIDMINKSLENIHSIVDFKNNFTAEQLMQLDGYINSSEYIDEHFIQTENMTSVEVQEQAQELMNQAKIILDKLSQPRYRFNIDIVNILELEEMKYFADQLSLGCELNIDMDNGLWTYPVLLGISFSESSPTDISLTFGNHLRMNGDDYTFEELFGETIKTSNSQKVDSTRWNEWIKSGASVEWINFKNNILDASLKELVNSSNQDMVFDQTGLKLRKYIVENETYDPKQIWMINNGIYMTRDNWSNLATVLGEFTLPDGTKTYGLIGETIVGDLLIGNALTIANESSTFKVTGDKVYIQNADIILSNGDDLEKEFKDISKTVDDVDEKINNVTTNDGKLDTSKMSGYIAAGENNIFCINSANNKALQMNENGIRISNQKIGEGWIFNTAITGDGMVAETIQAGNIFGCNLIGENILVGKNSGNNGITMRMKNGDGLGIYIGEITPYSKKIVNIDRGNIQLEYGGRYYDGGYIDLIEYNGSNRSTICWGGISTGDGILKYTIASPTVELSGKVKTTSTIESQTISELEIQNLEVQYNNKQLAVKISESEVVNYELEYRLKKQGQSHSELEIILMEKGVI